MKGVNEESSLGCAEILFIMFLGFAVLLLFGAVLDLNRRVKSLEEKAKSTAPSQP